MKSKSQQVFVKLSFGLFGIFHTLSTDVRNGELFSHQHETNVVLIEPGAFSEDLCLHFHTRGHPCYESTRTCNVRKNIPQWYRNRVASNCLKSFFIDPLKKILIWNFPHSLLSKFKHSLKWFLTSNLFLFCSKMRPFISKWWQY